ncbi:MAG: DsrE family protein [bacterium]|nr:DsrE family protein [bacterium]
MNVGILLRTGPYSYENADVVYHLSKALLKRGDNVTIFLFEDGIMNIVKDIKSPQERNIALMMKEIAAVGVKITACGTCAKFRGVNKEAIIENATLSGLATMSKIIKESDRFLTFGY